MRKNRYWLATIVVCLGANTPAQAEPSIPRPNDGSVQVVHPDIPGLVPLPADSLRPTPPTESIKAKSRVKLSEGALPLLDAHWLVAAYADELESKLKDKSAGYAFVVRYRDSTITAERSGGAARRSPDRNPRAMSVNDRLNIASVSKIITAATLLKLLIARKHNVETLVCDLLPADWNIGNNFETVTVRELLTHHSGMRFPGQVTLENLKISVAEGIELKDKAVCSYNNANFGLMRILIARLAVDNFQPNDQNAAEEYGSIYIKAVNQQIFAPAGLCVMRCQPDATNPAQCYQFPATKAAGTDFGDTSEISGSQGWNMSALELSTVGSKLFFSTTNAIMPSQQVDVMVNEQLGIFSDMLTPTIAEFGHNGFYPGKDENGQISNRGELNSLLLGFSNGISVAMLINSQLVSDASPTATAKQAMATTLDKI